MTMPGPPLPRPRARELGIEIGLLPVGPTNSIVDVPHVRVGHATVWRDEAPPPAGRGVARTGVTAIVPFEGGDLFGAPVPAGGAVLNGAGEVIGLTAIQEWAILETPIFLTSSMSIGRVYDAAVWALVEADSRMGIDDALMPVVGECDDGYLNDARHPQIEADDVVRALAAAFGSEAGAVGEGVVGAGTGMCCHGLKGGIGSASRWVRPTGRRSEGRRGVEASGAGPTYTLGALALTNYGLLERLTLAGVPVGRVLRDEGWPEAGIARATGITPRGADSGDAPGVSSTSDVEAGSCVVVIATDAPMNGHQLERLARRAGLGLARCGSTAGHASGEIFLAFSTGLRWQRGAPQALHSEEIVHDEYLGAFFAAAVEATEEAVIDSLFVADTVIGRDGHVGPGLPVERTLELVRGGHR
jgi:D-aminopeptidase